MTQQYAGLLDRIKAYTIDMILIIVLMYFFSEVTASFTEVPNYVRIILFSILFVFYDPLFVSISGGTVGHTFMDISVRQEVNSSKKISFPSALFRFIVKFLLGWLSFITIGSKKKKAIHDKAVGSVVIKLSIKK
ncbi:RDD family protein [Dokdonia sp.]|uniref:RDD family protein n=1 Tax=Dokdonia sp. TaxID=2024995 RepID=UPI00326521C1